MKFLKCEYDFSCIEFGPGIRKKCTVPHLTCPWLPVGWKARRLDSIQAQSITSFRPGTPSWAWWEKDGQFWQGLLFQSWCVVIDFFRLCIFSLASLVHIVYCQVCIGRGSLLRMCLYRFGRAWKSRRLKESSLGWLIWLFKTKSIFYRLLLLNIYNSLHPSYLIEILSGFFIFYILYFLYTNLNVYLKSVKWNLHKKFIKRQNKLYTHQIKC